MAQAKIREPLKMQETLEKENAGLLHDDDLVERFPDSFRKQHMLLIITFTTLLITGIPLLAPKFFLFSWIFSVPGMFAARSFLHRLAAAVFIGQSVYHVFFMAFKRDGRRDFLLMLPKKDDAAGAIGTILWNLGLKKEHPHFGRFSFIEKVEYLALIWGTIIMIVSGLILWLNMPLLAVLPKIVFDVSTIIHSFEAVLAGLSIIIWHTYTVHLHPDFFPMNRAWLDGKISVKNMKKHHYLEYIEMMKNRGEPLPSGECSEKRDK